MEARLMDFVSKNLNSIMGNIKHFAKEGLESLEKLKEGPENLNKSFEKLEQTMKGRGGITGFAAKFAGLSLLFRGVEESLHKVFESALRSSPELEESVEKVKGKVNQLVTEVGQKLVPVFITVFDFLLKNWEKVRFAINVVVAATKDLFNLFVMGLQTITLGFKGFILGVTAALNKLGIVKDATFQKMVKDTEEYKEKVLESAEALKVFGNTRDTVSKGVAGQGKAPKANIDIFNKNEKKDAEELVAFRLKIEKQNEELTAKMHEEGRAKDLAESAAKFENLKLDMEKDKNFKKLTALEVFDAETNIAVASRQEQLNINKKYDDAEKAYRDKTLKDMAALRADTMGTKTITEQYDRELEASKVKFEGLKQQYLDDKNFQIMSKKDQETIITDIEAAASADRQKILEAENKARLEKAAEVMGKVSQSYKVLGDIVTTFATGSEQDVQKSADKQTKVVDNQFKHGLITQEQAEAKKQKILNDAEKKNKERAEIAKQVAVGLAIINIAQGVTKALAMYDFFGAALIGITGGLEIAKIEAQEFREGGLITGKNRLFTTNEDGKPEFMLNAQTVARVGVDNLNRLNQGGDMSGGGSSSGTMIINNHFSPTTNMNGSSNPKSNFEQVLEQHSDVFFNWMEDKMKKGYGKGIRGK